MALTALCVQKPSRRGYVCSRSLDCLPSLSRCIRRQQRLLHGTEAVDHGLDARLEMSEMSDGQFAFRRKVLTLLCDGGEFSYSVVSPKSVESACKRRTSLSISETL
tara:strand:+ start:8532 stop:8849 length:318 start_codon:yes stop_codon:yes gene_type:complete